MSIQRKNGFYRWCLVTLLMVIALVGCGETEGPVVDEPSPEANSSDLHVKDDSSQAKLGDKSIVFMSKKDNPHGDLYRIARSGAIERLTTNERHDNNPAVSPDGKWLAFHGGEEGDPLTWEIFVLNMETGEEVQVTNNQVIDGHPDWSPDGTKLIFSHFGNDKGEATPTADLYLYDLQTKEMTQLTHSPHEENDPEWSPDGQWIVYKSTERTQEAGREEIYVMRSDGSDPRRLTTTQGWESDHDPSWSPDSRRIVFERFMGDTPWYRMGETEFLIKNVDRLTPWNLFEVTLEGDLRQLTQVDKGDIAFLPIYGDTANQVLYILIDFLIVDGQVIGAEKHIYALDTETGETTLVFEDEGHKYYLEYFDR